MNFLEKYIIAPSALLEVDPPKMFAPNLQIQETSQEVLRLGTENRRGRVGLARVLVLSCR